MANEAPLICEIVDLIHDGRGVGRPDGKACFIDGALPGETVEFRRHNQKRNYDEAHVLNVVSASPSRVDPTCKHFPECLSSLQSNLLLFSLFLGITINLPRKNPFLRLQNYRS